MNDYRPPVDYPRTTEYYYGVIDTCRKVEAFLKTSPAVPIQTLYDHLWELIDFAELGLETIGEEEFMRCEGRL